MAQNVNDDEQDTKSEVGYVYAMSTQTLSIAGVFKIGVTNDLHRRKKDLSASTSAPEEFHVAYFVRCKSMQDAKRLESSVKRTLDEEGCTYRPNREFYRLGTVVPLWGCFREGAEALGITIVENIRADPCEIIDETYNEVVISKVHFDAIDTAYRKFYLRGAQDLSGLIMLSELSAEQSELAASIYGRLSDTVIPNPDPTNLFAMFCNALEMTGHQENLRILRNQLEHDGADTEEDLGDWRELIDHEVVIARK